MVKRFSGIALVLLALSAGAGAQDAAAVIAGVSKTMGVEGVGSITYSGTAADINFLQSRNIDRPPLRPITGYTRTLNLQEIGSRATGATNNQGLFGGAPVPGTFNQGITPTNAAWAQQMDYWITPWGFLKGAAANKATVRSARGGQVITWSPPMKAPSGASYVVNGYVNSRNLIDRVETWVEDAMLGDMHVEATYSEYKDFGSLKVPGRIVQKRGGFTFFDVTVADAKANPENLTALLAGPPPPAGRGGGAPGGAPAGARAGGSGGAAAE